jgi:hypothetical protein
MRTNTWLEQNRPGSLLAQAGDRKTPATRRVRLVISRSEIAVGILVLAGLVTHLAFRHLQAGLREQNRALQKRVAQLTHLGAKNQPEGVPTETRPLLSEAQVQELLRARGQVGVLRREQEELHKLHLDNRRLQTGLARRLLEGKAHVSLEQLAPYLEAKQRSAESLIAAFHATGDPAALREAVEKYPGDPRVLFATGFRADSPEERRQLLEAFKQSAPDNALANYLSAWDYFKAGQSDRAVQELSVAASKPQFQDYASDSLQELEEAYRTAGCTTAGACMAAAYLMGLDNYAQLRGLANNLADLAALYRQAGDESSAQVALQMGVALGRQVGEPSGGKPTCVDLLGIEIERRMLAGMDPASPCDSSGATVSDRLNELARLCMLITEVGGDVGYWVPQALSEQDQISFFDRLRASGELEALRWARSRQAKP